MSQQSSKPSIFTPRFVRKLSQPPALPDTEAKNILRTPDRARRQSSPASSAQRPASGFAASVPPPPPLPTPPTGIQEKINAGTQQWTGLADTAPAATIPAVAPAPPLAAPRLSEADAVTVTPPSAPHLVLKPPPPPTTPPANAPSTIPLKRRRGHNTYLGIPELAPGYNPFPNGPTSEPRSKRAKLLPRNKHTLRATAHAPTPAPPVFSFSGAEHVIQPPSPLFFSNSPRARPELPPRFSSSEAAARMLSNARSEDSHVKTVSLARGTIASASSGHLSTLPSLTSAPAALSNPANRRSLDRSASRGSHSPDSNSGYGNSRDAGPLSGMLNSIGIIELLDQDERPTFILDLADSGNYGDNGPLRLVFVNSSLRSYDGLSGLVAGIFNDAPSTPSPGGYKAFLQFKVWLLSAAVNGESLNVCLPPFSYAGMTWSCSTLRKRLRIISGAFNSPRAPDAEAAIRTSIPPAERSGVNPTPEPSDYFGNAASPAVAPSPVPPLSDSSSSVATEVVSTIEEPLPPPRPLGSDGSNPLPHHYSDAGNTMLMGSTDLSPSHANTLIPVIAADAPCFDWTRLPLSDQMPEHIRFARSVDWAATSLGPIENWTSDLRQMCNLIMASPHPAAMYWGDDLIAIYNEAYVVLAGQKHPKLMGMSYRVAWAEIWDEVHDVFASAKTTGEATMKDDDCLFIRRADYLEETYFSWSIIPMVGRDGSVMGLYNPAFEKTRRKIAERRMLTLREVGERTASARDVRAFWAEVLAALELNEYDSPLLLLYSVSDDTDSDGSSMHSNSVFAGRQCTLEGSLGIPADHPAAPSQIDLKAGLEGFGPAFREVMKTNRPVLLDVGSVDLPADMLEGLDPRGFGDPLKSVLICPIHPTTGETVLGFLVLGVNPRRPYDDDYSLFVQLLTRQLATSLASVVLFEEEIRRGQRAAKLAALDRIELSEQLAARTQEAIDSETKFTRMAEFAPVGMFIAGSDGKITFANDTWYDISRVSKTSQGGAGAEAWMDAVMPEDAALVTSLWRDLVVHTKPVTSEFRFKAPWRSRSGAQGDTWVLFSCFPEKYDDGRLKSIFGVITDISQQKWAEGLQTRKMEEAVELKRQQENFIDMTSHEMRNPLSAILQCSDEIETSLGKFKATGSRDMPDELLANCLDAAQTIRLCSQHQKRIVDDILTLSKLDSQLLLVTPVDAQPLTVVQRALKMHEGELQAADIQMTLVVDPSFRALALDWVRFDPSRVLQVLINLTTNAIKFTSSEPRRTITVTIAASKQRPSDETAPKAAAPVKYFATRRKNRDAMQDPAWGDGELVYILFSVRDTGRGLNPEEKKLLFLRFSQASPRTHVQYGGSGLGLFISRELTELQGGEIGVESEAGKGSTFAFYVSARRASPPAHDTDGATGHKRAPPASLHRSGSTATASKSSALPAPASVDSGAGSRKTSTTSSRSGLVKRVLIVEDNLVNQRVLQKQLKNLGTEVHLANHGGEALERLKQSTYWKGGDGDAPATDAKDRLHLGVVLMDQEMPVMDGLTCTRRIRELEKEGKLVGHVPIIAVTANARPEQVQTALDAGMDDVVSKPFRIPELVPKIEELLEKYPMP